MFCNYCGASNPVDAIFCSACGKRTIHTPAAVPAHAETVHSKEMTAEVPIPVDPIPEAAYAAAPQPATAARGRGGRTLWIVAVLVVVLLVAIIGVLAINKGRGGASSSDGAPSGDTSTPPSGPPPVPGTTPPPGDSATTLGTPGASPAPAGQGTVVGSWKTPVPLMADTTLDLTAGGRYHLKSALADESGTYVFGDDGSLKMQPDGLFDNSIVTWHCQISGDSMSVIESDGAAHIYTRVQ